MRRFSICCFTGRNSKAHRNQEHLQRSGETTENPQTSITDNSSFEKLREKMVHSQNSVAANIILNHDFSGGLHSWNLNCCDGHVVSGESGNLEGASPKSGGSYAVITNRKESWQGLEQDITSRVLPVSIYIVSAYVRVSGPLQGSTGSTIVQATLKLEYPDSATSYLSVGRASVSKERWEKLEGKFSLSTMPNRVVFYLEGPPPDVDLLIESVVISCSNLNECEGSGETTDAPETSCGHNSSLEKIRENMVKSQSSFAANIILNHDFSGGLHSWHLNCCDGRVVSGESGYLEGASKNSGGNYALITNRKECWQGLEQDITSRVSPGSTYSVSACVRVSGPLQGSAGVQATLRVEYPDSETSYLFIGRASVSERWEKLEGTFSLSTMPYQVVFYLEGPNPGVDLLIKSVVVSCSSLNDCESTNARFESGGDENIILNPQFEDGLSNWSGRGCKILVHNSMGDGKIFPLSKKFFASATQRTQSWNGIQQDITGRVQRKLAYKVTVGVRIFGNNVTCADVQATLWVQMPNRREQYIIIAKLVNFTSIYFHYTHFNAILQATDKEWVELQGKFLLNVAPSRVVIYLEGPPPGTDILVNSLVVEHAAKIPPPLPPVIENAAFGVNIIQNSSLDDGLNGWSPLGNCTLSIGTGSPHVLPPMARDSLGPHKSLSGRYILVTNRTQTWMGPSQMITDKLKLYLTYQVSAWVRVGPGTTGPHNVNVAFSVDSQWVNGGQVEAIDDKWHEIGGSFRIERKPSKVMVYIQGPSSGVDLMVAGLQIFPVNRQARFEHLKRQSDKIRKCDVILKFSGLEVGCLSGISVKVKQTQNSFPLGSCISRTNMDNEDFVDFFVKNFNWAVFGNELKWSWTEPQQCKLNYKDADELLGLCNSHNIETRGHCLFWEVEDTVQSWVRSLNKNDLMTAIQNRLTSLLKRYKEKFRHYDVNNEMLHGSFYQDRLGKDIRSYMFKVAHQLDPSATLFVNDYHIEDGCDARSSPENYIQHVLDLQEQGAPIGGIGIQGHIDNPVGPVVCSAMDKLGILALPIWFTELDVSSINEYIRADDLEVMLREGFAHPSVEGIMLWGFWELFMSRDNAHLVDAEGRVNEAGKRYLALKQEWLSETHGHIDHQGVFRFRGYHGTYNIEVVSPSKRVSKTFVVKKGESPLAVTINL
ncbi:hypothetical protein HHK36_009695 [Tetracentron sinense]|uniref:GH10 domain-containing protein n=1 Tax=Tetracentron sinense TaxID=13715 RepID=A0A834ZFN9_TETSI|nr:hypothetical protein HHK36_009695 [Tetracentron sinense]